MGFIRFNIGPPPTGPICDFCSDPNVYAAYQCNHHVVRHDDLFVTESPDGWAACRVCSELIDAGKWNELLNRSVDTFMQEMKVPFTYRWGLRQEIKRIHDLFRQHMRKPA